MYPLGIFASLFLLVMGSIVVVGYAVLERRRVTEESASPLLDTLRRIGRAAPVQPGEADRLRQQLSMAGYRSRSAEPIYAGIRVALSRSASGDVRGPVWIHAAAPNP